MHVETLENAVRLDNQELMAQLVKEVYQALLGSQV